MKGGKKFIMLEKRNQRKHLKKSENTGISGKLNILYLYFKCFELVKDDAMLR